MQTEAVAALSFFLQTEAVAALRLFCVGVRTMALRCIGHSARLQNAEAPAERAMREVLAFRCHADCSETPVPATEKCGNPSCMAGYANRGLLMLGEAGCSRFASADELRASYQACSNDSRCLAMLIPVLAAGEDSPETWPVSSRARHRHVYVNICIFICACIYTARRSYAMAGNAPLAPGCSKSSSP